MQSKFDSDLPLWFAIGMWLVIIIITCGAIKFITWLSQLFF